MVGKSFSQLHDYLKKELNNSFEAGILFEHITGVSKDRLAIIGDNEAENKYFDEAKVLAKKRQNGEPLQYIIGIWEFYSLPFYVGEGVLIPRADTETLVDYAVETLRYKHKANVVDLCAGSGCIGISIEKNTTAQVVCIELSETAFGYLEKNKQLNESKVTIINEDVLEYSSEIKFDMVVSNPPYIPKSDLDALQIEVKKEPSMALDGGNDGLDFYRAISKRYYEYINDGGHIAFEVGIGQSDQVKNILINDGYANVIIKKDLAGIDRVVAAQK